MARAPISLIILTYNDEPHIRFALESVKDWVDEILVIDSFSTDATERICREYTDRFYQHKYENQAKQFNWAIDHLPLNFEWVLRLDSDEFIPPELAEEIARQLPAFPPDVTGVFLRRRVFFMDRWIRHGGYYPRWFLRLFRRGKGRYEELTEEHFVLAEGRSVRMRHDFIDYNRKSLSYWTDKHNHCATGLMLDMLGYMGEGPLPQGTVEPSLFGTQEQRTRWLLRNLYARAPLHWRAFAYFLYRFILRLGFLDGREGLIYHFLQGCWYLFYVDAKIYEAKKFGLERASYTSPAAVAKAGKDA